MTTSEKRGFRLPWGAENRKDEEGVAGPTPVGSLTAATDLAPALAPAPMAPGGPRTGSTLRRGQLDDLGRGPFDLEPASETAAAAPDPTDTLVDVVDPVPPKPAAAKADDPPVAWPDIDRRDSPTHLASDAPPPPVRPAVADGTGAPSKRSNPLVAGLVKAMRDAARSARDETTTRMRADATARVDEIRAEAAAAGVSLKKRADEDIAGIREWSRAEAARIKQETETRIAARRAELVRQGQAHATETDRYMEEVKATIAGFESEMDRFFEILLAEDDPGRLATLAERLPEPPVFARRRPIDGEEAPAARTRAALGARTRATATQRRRTEPAKRRARPASRLAPDAAAAAEAEAIAGLDDAVPRLESPTAAHEPAPLDLGAPADEVPPVDEHDTDGHAAVAIESPAEDADALSAWTAALSALRSEPPAEAPGEAPAAPADPPANDAPDDETPEGDVAPAGSLAAVLATAPRINSPDDLSPEERIALLGFEESAADDDPGPEAAPPPLEDVTRVVISGLTSVAGISAFKSALAAVTGVLSVSVTAGHEGAFVFSVVHASSANLRAAVPALSEFAPDMTSDEGAVLNFAVTEPNP
jgi:hypothetical protein